MQIINEDESLGKIQPQILFALGSPFFSNSCSTACTVIEDLNSCDAIKAGHNENDKVHFNRNCTKGYSI